jgi:hypothetical protein
MTLILDPYARDARLAEVESELAVVVQAWNEASPAQRMRLNSPSASAS